mgnify:CR=1 FL=1
MTGFNFNYKSPDDFTYVSKKHWARKQNVENNEQLPGMLGRPGPITGIVLYIIDILLYFILRFVFFIFDITHYSFKWIYNMIFGNFTGIIPKSVTDLSNGKAISTKFFRYTMNVLMPPFGIFLSKGIYGWFSILVCLLLTYVNYMAGIIYTFVVTTNNRYADQYEANELDKYNKKVNQEEIDKDISAFVSSIAFFLIIGVVFYFFLGFF